MNELWSEFIFSEKKSDSELDLKDRGQPDVHLRIEGHEGLVVLVSGEVQITDHFESDLIKNKITINNINKIDINSKIEQGKKVGRTKVEKKIWTNVGRVGDESPRQG